MKKYGMKPTKVQAMLSFLMGIIFLGIGFFVVIPQFGLVGVLWTLLAGGMTIFNGAQAFSKKAIDTYEVSVSEEHTTTTYSGESRLLELADLYNKNLITREEYDKKRVDIIETL